jgi:hypothetical protein
VVAIPERAAITKDWDRIDGRPLGAPDFETESAISQALAAILFERMRERHRVQILMREPKLGAPDSCSEDGSSDSIHFPESARLPMP